MMLKMLLGLDKDFLPKGLLLLLVFAATAGLNLRFWLYGFPSASVFGLFVLFIEECA